MDLWDFKKWRRKLRYSQENAAQQFGLSRSAIYMWETERTKIAKFVELACEELARKWQQRPEFGPVTLIYSDEPLWSSQSHRKFFVQCELHANNETALKRVFQLRQTKKLVDALVIGQDGQVLWAPIELLEESERVRDLIAERD